MSLLACVEVHERFYVCVAKQCHLFLHFLGLFTLAGGIFSPWQPLQLSISSFECDTEAIEPNDIDNRNDGQ